MGVVDVTKSVHDVIEKEKCTEGEGTFDKNGTLDSIANDIKNGLYTVKEIEELAKKKKSEDLHNLGGLTSEEICKMRFDDWNAINEKIDTLKEQDRLQDEINESHSKYDHGLLSAVIIEGIISIAAIILTCIVMNAK